MASSGKNDVQQHSNIAYDEIDVNDQTAIEHVGEGNVERESKILRAGLGFVPLSRGCGERPSELNTHKPG